MARPMYKTFLDKLLAEGVECRCEGCGAHGTRELLVHFLRTGFCKECNDMLSIVQVAGNEALYNIMYGRATQALAGELRVPVVKEEEQPSSSSAAPVPTAVKT